MANAVARRLRKRTTIGEMLLWKELRELRRQGYHFRRQVPNDKYIVLRFRNDEVSDAMHGVMLEVLAALGAIEKQE